VIDPCRVELISNVSSTDNFIRLIGVFHGVVRASGRTSFAAFNFFPIPVRTIYRLGLRPGKFVGTFVAT